MVIREKFIMGKHPNTELCEDALFVSDNFIAVLDGVTSKSNRSFNNMSGGKAAAEAALSVLRTVPAHTCKNELFEAINNAVAEIYNGSADGSAAVCVIAYSKFHKEIWAVGDCQCLINGDLHTHEKLIDRELSEIRAQVIEDALKQGAALDEIAENDIGRQAIMPQLKEQHQFANRADHPYGYAVLNGGYFDTESIVTYSVNEGDTIIFASDGYPKLFDTLQKSEEYLKHIISTDPLCIRDYKSTKGLQEGYLSFDDRTYIKFTI